ncbi:alpha/beta fold hydrolase [Halomicroarcula sp. GCM10025324]|uniref:alpha/beta fold hydrolase n=1 Tax=Haloarcula TaxID=2237 RepID=UPI0023E81C77|nr:alpha/beta hydrolase [Halomicroarcula sp. ZS-22-S1]
MTDSLSRATVGETSYLVGGEGAPVVFIHGIPGSAHTWEPVAERLTDRYHVLLPDLRGFGYSEPPAGDYYLDAQAAALDAFLDALEVDPFALVTHDFGGPVALTLDRRFPRESVGRLVLASTNVFTDNPVPPPLRVAGVPVLGTLLFTAMVGNRFGLRLLHRAAVEQRSTLPWSQFQRHLTPSAMSMTRRIFQRSLADLEGNYGPIERSLPGLDVPTLVLWGDSDPFFDTAVAERTADAIPESELTIFEDTGHFVPEERPVEVAETVGAFLSE